MKHKILTDILAGKISDVIDYVLDSSNDITGLCLIDYNDLLVLRIPSMQLRSRYAIISLTDFYTMTSVAIGLGNIELLIMLKKQLASIIECCTTNQMSKCLAEELKNHVAKVLVQKVQNPNRYEHLLPSLLNRFNLKIDDLASSSYKNWLNNALPIELSELFEEFFIQYFWNYMVDFEENKSCPSIIKALRNNVDKCKILFLKRSFTVEKFSDLYEGLIAPQITPFFNKTHSSHCETQNHFLTFLVDRGFKFDEPESLQTNSIQTFFWDLLQSWKLNELSKSEDEILSRMMLKVELPGKVNQNIDHDAVALFVSQIKSNYFSPASPDFLEIGEQVMKRYWRQLKSCDSSFSTKQCIQAANLIIEEWLAGQLEITEQDYLKNLLMQNLNALFNKIEIALNPISSSSYCRFYKPFDNEVKFRRFSESVSQEDPRKGTPAVAEPIQTELMGP